MAKKRIPSSDDIMHFHSSGLYLPTRTIYMGSEDFGYSGDGTESGTDGAMVRSFIKNIHMLEDSSTEPITVVMNNLGGDVYSGLAIIDVITLSKCKITIIGVGHIMSAGSLIFQSADTRIMTPLATQMIPYGTVGSSGHSKTSQKQAREFERIDKWVEKYYLARIQERQPHFTLARVQRMLDHDTYLTAEQSLELGLTDKIAKKGI